MQINPIQKENYSGKSHPLNSLIMNDNITNLSTTRKKENLSQIKNNTDINPFKLAQNNFKARVLPNFTYLEVKKSNKSLTVPKSPELKTKERSVSKFKNKLNE